MTLHDTDRSPGTDWHRIARREGQAATAIKPFLPNKSRGVRRVNDRRVLNGIFWVLRSGAPWRDLPVCYGHVPPATTVSSGGEGPVYGTGSWAHLPPLMMRPSK